MAKENRGCQLLGVATVACSVVWYQAALHSPVRGGCGGPRAPHPSASGYHAYVLRQDQSRLQPHHLLPKQQAGVCTGGEGESKARVRTHQLNLCRLSKGTAT